MTSIKFSNLNIADEELLCNIADEESLSVNGGFRSPWIPFVIPWISFPRPHIPRILPKC